MIFVQGDSGTFAMKEPLRDQSIRQLHAGRFSLLSLDADRCRRRDRS